MFSAAGNRITFQQNFKPNESDSTRSRFRYLARGNSLFRNLGDVNNGFPKRIPLEELSDREQYNAGMLEENLMFGSPEMVIEKLKRYQALGVDEFIYYASMGLGHAEQKRSLELFCNEVMPAFV